MRNNRPPSGIPAERWRLMIRQASIAIAEAQSEPNNGTPEEYADAALRSVAHELRQSNIAARDSVNSVRALLPYLGGYTEMVRKALNGEHPIRGTRPNTSGSEAGRG